MDSSHIEHNLKDWPAWGSLPLDSYMITHWDESLCIPDNEQRLQLARNYVACGRAILARMAQQAKNCQKQPTQDQISRILRPFRAPSLRYVAERLINDGGNFIWLRTDYDHQSERKDFITKLLSFDFDTFNWAEYLYKGGPILSDVRHYNVGSQWRQVLDLLPEIVDFQIPVWPDEYHAEIKVHHQSVKRDYMEWDCDHYNRTEPDVQELNPFMETDTGLHDTPWQAEASLFKTRTVDCHAISCETILFVEDWKTHTTTPATFNILWLDERAAVVRHTRATAEEACQFLTDVEKSWDDTCFSSAEIGPDYARGATRGPPYIIEM